MDGMKEVRSQQQPSGTAAAGRDPSRRVWNVPSPRNKYFSGREDLLANLRKVLVSERRAVLVDARGSAGGLGKTQTAQEYAYRFARDYRAVWWVQAERPATLAVQYSQLASALELPAGRSDDQPRMIAAARSWLAHHNAWLLILDGLGEAEGLDRFIPNEAAGHVLITSSQSHDESPGTVLPVAAFEPQEAAEFLTKRSGREQDEHAQALAACLGHVPLALELAGAYTASTDASFEESTQAYISKLARSEDSSTEDRKTLRIVHAVLGPTLRRVREACPPAVDLLAFFAFMGPGDLSLALLRDEREVLSKRLSKVLADDKVLNTALNALSQYGLVHRGGDAIRIHGLVQHAIRDGMGEEQHNAWASAALRVVAGAFPVEAQYDHAIPTCSRLLGHALAVTGHTESRGVARKETEAFLNQAGLYLHGCREFTEAQRCFRHAIALGRSLYGDENSTVATRVNNLGVAYQDEGDLEQARDCFRRTISICEAVHGRDHKSLAMPMRNLGVVLKKLGELEEARIVHGKTLIIYDKIYQLNHPLVAECANSLGGIWRSLGRLDKAKKCYEKAILSTEHATEAVKGALAKYLNNLGKVLIELRKVDLARAQFERALAADREDFGEAHSAVGRDLVNLGQVLSAQGEVPKAQACYESALRIRAATDGSDSVEVARVLKPLGRLLYEGGKVERARSCFVRALAIDEAAHGPEGAEVAKDLLSLAPVLEDLGAYADAHTCLTRALAMEEKADGEDQEKVAHLLSSLGRVIQAQDRPREAVEYYERALAIHTAIHGKEHETVAQDAYWIGCVLMDLDDSIVALGHLGLAHAIFEKSLGSAHPKTKKVRGKLDELGYKKAWSATD